LRSGNPYHGRALALAALVVLGGVALRAQLEKWVQHTPSGAAMGALVRSVAMPGGAVPVLRPPADSRAELTSLIAAAPQDAPLYKLRAQEAELALDFAAAEADWKTYAGRVPDATQGQIELADFYHRRMRSADELAALGAAANAKDDPLLGGTAQRGWRAFERMAALPEAAEPVFRAWVARYPKEPGAWSRLIQYLSAHKQYAAAEAEIANYGREFSDEAATVRMRAELELQRGNRDAALAIYDRALQPLSPEAMRASYFQLLEQEGQLREFAGRARTALAANPSDLEATARLYHYFKSQNNGAAARRALLEYRIAKESGRQPWTADELRTMAQLFEWLPDVNEAARMYYALYSAPGASAAQAERALYGLANLLLTAPEQPIQFGSGDLSFYKDIATLDSSPGFLNGILSLLLNWTGPRGEYQRQNEKSAAYFHRAAAAQLVALLERRFPQSSYRTPLRASLISAYGAYGDDDSVIRAGREYLAAFPTSESRVAVAMQVSDALARSGRSAEEFALYDQMLRELAAKASGVPLGAGELTVQPDAQVPSTGFRFVQAQQAPATAGVRSAEYVRVLDKYLSRLSGANRVMDALRVYRTEVDRNPNDPGLYQRLAAFLEQHNMARDVEAVYTSAIARFADRSWYHKLARWYLRTRQSAALEKVSRDAIAVFSGSELENYFSEIVTATHPDAALYLQLNLYAHERFPQDLVFVQNLLAAYSRTETADPAAHERLLRRYWFYDPRLRPTLMELLSARGRLDAELADVRAANPGMAVAANPAAVQFVAEAEAWRSHFEDAAPAERALAVASPGRRDLTERASALYRSLAAYDPRNSQIAVAMAELEQRANPRDPAILARIGDIWADRELFGRARPYWERMPATQPRNPDAYLDAATVYWDYYRFADALRWIAAARKKFDDPALFAYQAGAIYEGRRDYTSAVREYAGGALHGEAAAERRLLRLAGRAETRALVDRNTASAIAGDPSPRAVALRIAVLEGQQRRPELEALLEARVGAEKSSVQLTVLEETARRLGFDQIEARAGERLAAITNDPVDKMRLTLANVRLLESKKDVAGAARVVDALYRDHPAILGVVRGAVDFHVRNHQPGEAIDLLLEASKRARADLAAQFVLESARIATAAGQTGRARTLLDGLLNGDPLRAEYLTAMADTYLQAKDDAGYRDYQRATIEKLKRSGLTPAERAERVVTLRRSLIPVLDRLKDSAGAVDQYIEAINSYPEDEALTREAATYAAAHAQAARMVAFYRKTAADSPLDYRWPVVLGRVETVTEDYPAAIADYERGIRARPDRADLFAAKGRLEERLMRFDDAIRTYGRLYELAYRAPDWMIKVAELQARLGRNSEAVNALKAAILGARTETAEADFEIAERLEEWHLLPEAVTFAERGAALPAAESSKSANDAIYTRLMARARRIDVVAANAPAALGGMIAETYTPEEKARLEQALSARAAQLGRTKRDESLLPFAASAGLFELEARWRLETMQGQSENVDQRLTTLQSQRGLYGQLARDLEDYAAKNPGRPAEANAFTQSAQAYIAAGDMEGQVRVMRKALARNSLSGILLDRYLALMAAREPDQLLAVVRGNPSASLRNRAVQIAIGSERAPLALSAVQTRGGALPPVWSKAYGALAGMYFDDRSAATDAAFQGALDTRTIGERLKAPLKPDAAISGTVWFYYGARYGEYLTAGGNTGAEAWLPATVEAAPQNAEAYMTVGNTLSESGQPARAIVEFEHALELDPDRGDAQSRIARVLWSGGRRTEAVARWKAALAIFLRIQSAGVRVPETFWGRLSATFHDIGELHAIREMRPDIEHLLGDYYQRNRDYRLNELIDAAARAAIASGEDTAWLVELGRSIDNPEMVVYALMRIPGLTDAQRIALQRELVAARAKQANGMFGDSRTSAEYQEAHARWQLVSMLLDAGDVKGAAAEWSQLSPTQASGFDSTVEIRLSARTGTLAALFERYRTRPETATSADVLLRAVVALRNDHEESAARQLLEFTYERELREGRLQAANFLGLAEVKLQGNDTAAGIALLNRMALVVEDGFDTLLPAGELLSKYGKTAEAADFIRRRVKAVPWDSEAEVHLARMLAPGDAERAPLLNAAVNDSLAAYATRAEAARLGGAGATGTELALLASRVITPEAAAKPYQVEARILAAGGTPDTVLRLRLYQEALSLAPADERARLGAVRSALGARQDSLAVALAHGRPQPVNDYSPGARYYGRSGVMRPYRQPPAASPLPADLAEGLAGAAERLDDLNVAQSQWNAAIAALPVGDAHRVAVERHLKELAAEQDRRAKNAARQPVIKDVIEQDQRVRPRIARSVQ
jgi:Tfp pilus assembly protein PilF